MDAVAAPFVVPLRIHVPLANMQFPSFTSVPGTSVTTLASVVPNDAPMPGSAPIAPPAAPLATPQTSSSAGGGGHGLTSLLLLATLGMATLIGSWRIRDPVLAPGQQHYRPPVSPG